MGSHLGGSVELAGCGIGVQYLIISGVYHHDRVVRGLRHGLENQDLLFRPLLRLEGLRVLQRGGELPSQNEVGIHIFLGKASQLIILQIHHPQHLAAGDQRHGQLGAGLREQGIRHEIRIQRGICHQCRRLSSRGARHQALLAFQGDLMSTLAQYPPDLPGAGLYYQLAGLFIQEVNMGMIESKTAP